MNEFVLHFIRFTARCRTDNINKLLKYIDNIQRVPLYDNMNSIGLHVIII